MKGRRGHDWASGLRGTNCRVWNKLQRCVVQHREARGYSIITINGIWSIKLWITMLILKYNNCKSTIPHEKNMRKYTCTHTHIHPKKHLLKLSENRGASWNNIAQGGQLNYLVSQTFTDLMFYFTGESDNLWSLKCPWRLFCYTGTDFFEKKVTEKDGYIILIFSWMFCLQHHLKRVSQMALLSSLSPFISTPVAFPSFCLFRSSFVSSCFIGRPQVSEPCAASLVLTLGEKGFAEEM